jgi:hypothetical protein
MQPGRGRLYGPVRMTPDPTYRTASASNGTSRLHTAHHHSEGDP